jgi:hypothetical protein
VTTPTNVVGLSTGVVSIIAAEVNSIFFLSHMLVWLFVFLSFC